MIIGVGAVESRYCGIKTRVDRPVHRRGRFRKLVRLVEHALAQHELRHPLVNPGEQEDSYGPYPSRLFTAIVKAGSFLLVGGEDGMGGSMAVSLRDGATVLTAVVQERTPLIPSRVDTLPAEVRQVAGLHHARRVLLHSPIAAPSGGAIAVKARFRVPPVWARCAALAAPGQSCCPRRKGACAAGPAAQACHRSPLSDRPARRRGRAGGWYRPPGVLA